MNFIIRTKNLKRESSKSAWKTATIEAIQGTGDVASLAL